MKSSIAMTVAALLASAAFAQQQQPRTYTQSPPGEGAQASTRAQQAPSSAEATNELGAIFDKLNTSHSGKMTKAEAQAHPTVAANFDAADTNHDGVLTKEEFVAAFKPRQ